jgi:hypothetical protein
MVRRRLPLVCVLVASVSVAEAQESPRPDQPPEPARPVGAYAGVEPGEAQPPPAFHRVARRRGRRRRAVLTWPGFTPLGDGGSRFFVQTTEPRVTETHIEQGRIVIVFPDSTTHVRNSRRWLETRFFNTPVRRARLERRGRRDMALVLHLREGVTVSPRVTTQAAPGGSFHYVYVDFPPGDYAPVVTPAPGEPSEGSVRPAEPPPAPAREVDPSLDAMDDERPPALQE